MVQLLQKILCLRAAAFQKGVKEAAVLFSAPNHRQIVRRKPKHRACQRRQKGDILPWVGNRLQQGPECPHLRGFQNIPVGIGAAANSIGRQGLAVFPGAVLGRAQQNYNVLRCHRPEAVAVPHHRTLVQHPPDAPGHKHGLCFVLRRAGKHPQLHCRVRQGLVGHSLHQLLLRAVVEPPHLGRHALAEHMVHRLHNLRTGPEIPIQQHLPPLPGPGRLHRDIGIVLVQKDAGLRLPELVDGLLYITDQKAIVLLPREASENGILDPVGILIFIHHDLPEPSAHLQGDACRAGPIFTQKQVQGLMLQIAKVQHMPLALQAAVALVKPAHQMHQSPLDPDGFFHILPNLPGGLGEKLFLCLQVPFEVIPHRLDRIPGIQIDVLGRKAQAAVVQVNARHRLVPGPALPQVPCLGNQPRKVLTHLGPVPAQLQAPLQVRNPTVQPQKQVLQKRLSPQRLGGILPGGGCQLQAAIQPPLRVRIAPGLFVDL